MSRNGAFVAWGCSLLTFVIAVGVGGVFVIRGLMGPALTQLQKSQTRQEEPPPVRTATTAATARTTTASAPARAISAKDGSIREPRRIKSVPPEYPPLARQARIQGSVILEATIDPHGKVSALRVVRGVRLLDDAAVKAVKQWIYEPTLLNGVAVPVTMTVTVNFKLADPPR